MYRRANKFSNRVLDTPKLDGKPQDCTQPRSVSTSVDNAALSTLQSRLASVTPDATPIGWHRRVL